MVKVFRRIRKRVLQKKKVTKYLAYAAGEIVLVMIGILLAVQVNTWNNERNENKEFLDLLQLMNSELYREGYEMDLEIRNSARAIRKLSQFENPDLSDTARAVDFLHVLKLPSFAKTSSAYEKLYNFVKQDSRTHRALQASMENVYERYSERLDRAYGPVQQSVSDTRSYLRDNYPWFSHRSNLDTMLNHVDDLSSPTFLNHVSSYIDTRQDHFIAQRILIRGMRTLEMQINGVLRKTENYRQWYEGAGYSKIEPTHCDSLPGQGPSNELGRCYFFAYNASNQPVEQFWVNPNGEHISYKVLAPGEVMLHRSFSGHRWVYVFEDGSCEGRYVEGESRYVVLGENQ